MADDDQPIEAEEPTEMGPPDEFREEAPRKEALVAEENAEENYTPSVVRPVQPAPLRDRVAATIVDLLWVGYLYWGTLLVYNFFTWKQLIRPFPLKGYHNILFHAIFYLLSFLYFFISEGVFFTTIGKFFCRLSVRDKSGEGPGLFAIALRNILKPIDLFFLIFPTWLLMEKTKQHQRLGDLLSGTVVTKHLSQAPRHFTVDGREASTTARFFIGLIDLGFLSAWLGSFALWIDPQRPIFSLFILLGMLLLYLIWFLVWDGLFNVSLGQLIFGCRLAKENGAPAGFCEGILKAFLSPLDIVSAVTLFLSNRRQSTSDVAAGTVVIHTKRSTGAMIAITVALILITGFWHLGLNNPRNFLQNGFKINFLSEMFKLQKGGLPRPDTETVDLNIHRFAFLMEDRMTPRGNSDFKGGEMVCFSIEIDGFAVRDNEAWLQEDLMVRYPDNAVGYRQENMVDFHQTLKNPEIPLEVINTLTLPANAQAGTYTLVITLHDRFANRQLTEQRTFRVAPASETEIPAQPTN